MTWPQVSLVREHKLGDDLYFGGPRKEKDTASPSSQLSGGTQALPAPGSRRNNLPGTNMPLFQ